MPNDERDPTLIKIEEPPKTRKSSKSSKPVGGIDSAVENKVSKNQSLATRMRPRNLGEFTGQEHILGPGKLLRCAIETDRVYAVIFYGPPGIGKTSLGQIIANQTKSTFEQLVGGEAGIDDIRDVLKLAKTRLNNTGACTTLFIDEVHRLIPAQLAPLLQAVENGVIKLIGATTENLVFTGKAPLISRSQIFELKPLTEDDVFSLLQRSLKDEERGLGKLKIAADEAALRHLATISDGDARKALNSLEIAATIPPNEDGVIRITLEVAEQSVQRKAVVYNKDAKYSAISAFQKSMRGSDPDAALYWLVKMIRAGEDPRYIARRMVVCASEDVGLADPMALLIANAAWQAVALIGWPDAKLQLAQATIYIATAPKCNSATRAIEAAEAEVDSGRTIPVPECLEDRHFPGVRRAGQKFDYKLPHDCPGHFVAQDYLGADKIFYNPTEQGAEKQIKPQVENRRKQFQEVRRQTSEPDATKKNLKPQTCSVCHHSRPYKDSLMCINGTELAKNPTPEKPLKVKPDHRCNSFEPVHPC
jgi:putative ATPase